MLHIPQKNLLALFNQNSIVACKMVHFCSFYVSLNTQCDFVSEQCNETPSVTLFNSNKHIIFDSNCPSACKSAFANEQFHQCDFSAETCHSFKQKMKSKHLEKKRRKISLDDGTNHQLATLKGPSKLNVEK